MPPDFGYIRARYGEDSAQYRTAMESVAEDEAAAEPTPTPQTADAPVQQTLTVQPSRPFPPAPLQTTIQQPTLQDFGGPLTAQQLQTAKFSGVGANAAPQQFAPQPVPAPIVAPQTAQATAGQPQAAQPGPGEIAPPPETVLPTAQAAAQAPQAQTGAPSPDSTPAVANEAYAAGGGPKPAQSMFPAAGGVGGVRAVIQLKGQTDAKGEQLLGVIDAQGNYKEVTLSQYQQMSGAVPSGPQTLKVRDMPGGTLRLANGQEFSLGVGPRRRGTITEEAAKSYRNIIEHTRELIRDEPMSISEVLDVKAAEEGAAEYRAKLDEQMRGAQAKVDEMRQRETQAREQRKDLLATAKSFEREAGRTKSKQEKAAFSREAERARAMAGELDPALFQRARQDVEAEARRLSQQHREDLKPGGKADAQWQASAKLLKSRSVENEKDLEQDAKDKDRAMLAAQKAAESAEFRVRREEANYAAREAEILAENASMSEKARQRAIAEDAKLAAIQTRIGFLMDEQDLAKITLNQERGLNPDGSPVAPELFGEGFDSPQESELALNQIMQETGVSREEATGLLQEFMAKRREGASQNSQAILQGAR